MIVSVITNHVDNNIFSCNDLQVLLLGLVPQDRVPTWPGVEEDVTARSTASSINPLPIGMLWVCYCRPQLLLKTIFLGYNVDLLLSIFMVQIISYYTYLLPFL
jgi:hypothetical protein